MKFIFVFLMAIPFISYSQPYPLHQSFRNNIDRQLLKNQKEIHSSLLPYTQKQLQKYHLNDSILFAVTHNKSEKEHLIYRKIWMLMRQKSIVELQKKDFTLTINPILNFQLIKTENGYLKGTIPLSINTRGIEAKGKISNSISYYSAFYENQAFFPEYINTFINKQLVVPGQGISKIFQKKGHDFSRSEAQINISKVYRQIELNATLGHGKHFIGNGYRSLLLSDNAFSYPFVKLNTAYKSFSYTLIYTALNSFEEVYYNRHYRKQGSFAYLSKLFGNKIELSLFEGIIWKTTDNKTYSKKITANYFNPIILSKIPFYGLNNEHNMVVGLNFRYDFMPAFRFYSQLMIDDCKVLAINNLKDFDNKFALQTGIKYFGSNKHPIIDKLLISAELNYATPYSYGHKNAYQNYSHLNQPLAHPLGGGFREFIASVDYTLFCFNLNARYQNAAFSLENNNSNYGTDIFKSQIFDSSNPQINNNIVGQGNNTTLQNIDLTLACIIKPKTNFRIFATIHERKLINNNKTDLKNYITFGIRTAINNYYYDF